MTLADALGLMVLLIGVPLNLYVVLKLGSLSRESPQAWVLRDRARLAWIVLVITVVFGLIFVNNDMDVPALSTEVTRLITRAALLVLAVLPAAGWLWLYRRS